MKKETNKQTKQMVLAGALALVCALAPFCVGAALFSGAAWGMAGYAVSASLLLLLILGSFAGDALLRRKIKGTKAKAVQERFEQRKARMTSSEAGEKRRLNFACALAVLYVVVLAVVSLAVWFFAGAAGETIRVTSLLALYLLFGLISRLLPEKEEQPDRSHALPEQDYPQLYSLARSAMRIGKKDPLVIFLGAPIPEEECNAGVGQLGNQICLTLGPTLLCVVTEEELLQIIRHEFAHVELDHTREFLRFNRLVAFFASERPTGSLTGWVDRALRLPTVLLVLEGEYYFLLSSDAKERRADGQAADAGDRAAQACALAKTRAHGLFLYEQEPYTNLFREERLPEDFALARIRQFRQALVEREGVWREIMEREIQAKSATHPTFRQRWDALGNCPYSLAPAPEEGDFAQECWAAAAESGRRLREAIAESYDKLREENYLSLLRIVRRYEYEQPELTPEEMRPVILAYYRLGLPEQAERLCDKLLRENDSVFATAFARYWKGVLLLYRYDKAGLAYLYEAMETNRNYIESGLEHIGKFCTMMGLEEELEAYRSCAVDYMQRSIDFSGGGIHAKADLTPEHLPEGWQEEILSYILKHSEGNVRQVYLVHERVNESYSPSSFVLRFRDGAPEEERGRIYDCVFRLLDDWPEDWEFCLYEYESSMEKALEKVPGCCIYTAN